MNKNYREISFRGITIDDAVKALLSYKEKGELVYCIFRDTILYSDNVSLDSAYKEILGKTKSEYDEQEKIDKENYQKEQNKYKEKIPELALMWKEKGRKILTKDKWELWDEIVLIRLNDLFQGNELKHCLEIIEILNKNGTIEEAKRKIYTQKHDRGGYNLVCAMVRKLCSKGEEFFNYINI